MSRSLALVISVVLLLAGGPAQAQTKVKVGVLKLTSSAPVFVGVEKGFFKEFGVEPELVYFQAAAPIATALAAGAVEVGATGLTAALYNIVLQGEKLWIVADKGREWAGFPLVGIVVQKELWDSGKVRSIKDLKGRTIGVTQLGSTFHYHIGNILEKEGLALSDVRIVPLQAMPATVEALKGKSVDAILVPQPFPGATEAQGFGKVLFWAGDLYPWQIAAVFYSKQFAGDREKAVAFMKGYVKASRYYHDAALVTKQSTPTIEYTPNYEDVVEITAKYTGAKPELIRAGLPYQDRNGRLWIADVEKQIKWWVEHGFMKSLLPVKEVVDPSFVEEAVKQLGG